MIIMFEEIFIIVILFNIQACRKTLKKDLFSFCFTQWGQIGNTYLKRVQNKEENNNVTYVLTTYVIILKVYGSRQVNVSIKQAHFEKYHNHLGFLLLQNQKLVLPKFM